jgi:hypothetical protein
METRRPFTLNEIDYRLSKDEHLTDFVHQRKAKTTNGQPSSSRHTTRDGHGNSQSIVSRTENEDTLLSFLAANGYPVTSMKELARLHPPDEFEAEISVISETLAYFDISSKRFIDVMPMVFETVFAVDFVEDLRNGLTGRLKLVGESGYENCKKYGADEPAIQGKRQELNWKLNILSDCSKIVSNLFKY